jgi:hypothetical protein
MPKNQPTLRYRVEPSRMFHGMWSVIDVFTGLPGEIGGFVSDCMSSGEAENMADTMNARDLLARGVVRSA